MLEDKLQTELHDARGPSGADLTVAEVELRVAARSTRRRQIAAAGIDPSPLRVIEGIERFPAKLQL